MMKKIHHSVVVEFDEDFLFSEMKDHLRNVMNRLVFHVECHDLFYGEIERQYPLAYELAKIGLQELGRLLNRCVPTVEFGYLALYFELALRGNYEAGAKNRCNLQYRSWNGLDHSAAIGKSFGSRRPDCPFF